MSPTNKKLLSETEIRTRFITPAIVQAGWDLHSQIREEVSYTKGRIRVHGRLHTRGKVKRVDYLLSHSKNQPLAVVEAKDNKHRPGDGMQKALEYAADLDVPFVFTSNGDSFVFHDLTKTDGSVEVVLALDAFPSSEDLWLRYCQYKGLATEPQQRSIEAPYHESLDGKQPRYYQVTAVNRVVQAVAQGRNRLLLVMATGTGKTYTAFQIIWRLWKSKQVKRVLFLADRNILVDQTRNNDFKPFGGAMTKISNRSIDKSYEIYLSLYQAVSGSDEEMTIYKSFSPDFFDLIVVDECHRGSAIADSAWREILEYFSSAIQIGLTATPKETNEVSNINYFGDPVYSYTLRQGIEDGFLAPYKVVRYDLDRDLQGWRPSKGFRDINGVEVDDRIYNLKDMDRGLVLHARTHLVAQKITEYLEETDPYQKTIVFCDNIDHAERMRRELVNLNASRVAENRKYVMRITGDEEEGKRELDNFIDPEQRYPVIATTSKLLATGVDAQTCKFIVLDQHIQSMTEFKQIIGRGTRINEEYGKFWFTIMDFKKVTELFADSDFDGDPVQIYQPGPGDPISPPETDFDLANESLQDTPEVATYTAEDTTTRTRYSVKDLSVSVVAKRVQYYGPDGKLITESLRDYTRERVGEQFASLDDFTQRWTASARKNAVIEELQELGVFWEALRADVLSEVGKDLDPFDLILHVAFGQPPLSRRERAAQVRKRNYFSKYEGTARLVLEGLLDKYADAGIETVEDIRVLQISPFTALGAPVELVRAFGGRLAYDRAVQDLEAELYAA